MVIVSGHLDSWDLGTGAIDDGAGVVVAMQTIHLLKDLGIHPRRTMRCVAWMSEEEGSEGAAAYMADHKDDFANHIGAIESDLGADHPSGIYYAGKPELGQWLRPVSQVLDAINAETLMPHRRPARTSTGSRPKVSPALHHVRTAASTSTITTLPQIPSTRSIPNTRTRTQQ